MTVATAHSGPWYSIVGTVGEVRAQLKVIRARPEKVAFGGNNAGTITLFVGSL